MIVFNGFEILEWIVIALMIFVFIVLTVIVWLRGKFRNWKDKRKKRK